MFHKKTLITLVALGLILSAGIAGSAAYSGNGGFNKADLTPEQRAEMQARHEEVKGAIDNNDYQAWQALIQEKQSLMAGQGFELKHNILDIIDSQEDFDLFVQAHQAMAAGDHQTAQAIRQELGFPEKRGFDGAKGGQDPAKRAALKAALANSDYEAWQELMDGKAILETIDTEEEFLQLVAAHQAAQDGDYATAKQIKAELGLKPGPLSHSGKFNR